MTKNNKDHGLSLKEQACFLWAICKYSKNPEACPVNLMNDLDECPFEEICEDIAPWAWLPILENRIIPETNR